MIVIYSKLCIFHLITKYMSWLKYLTFTNSTSHVFFQLSSLLNICVMVNAMTATYSNSHVFFNCLNTKYVMVNSKVKFVLFNDATGTH